MLDRAGAALATERERTRRLGALVEAGEQARVGLGDAELLDEVLQRVRPAYGDVRVGLVSDGRLDCGRSPVRPGRRWPRPGPHRGRRLRGLPAHGQGARRRRAGGARPGRLPVPDARAGDPLVATLATQLSITLENARLYRELGTLFRQYMSPDVAAALLADPDQAALGGSLVEVTALFADLRGFTTFSEGVEPAEIVRMLNRYHGAAVPCILDNGGTIVQFVGDATARPVQRAGPPARPRRAGGAGRAGHAAAWSRRSPPAEPTGRACGSAPTPGRRWSATSAARPCAASTRWVTRSTWRPGCRASPSPVRS